MEKKNSFLRVGRLSILWAVLAILLCAAPCGARTVASGETLNVGTGYPDVEIYDWLDVYGTVNMHPGAYVDWGIYTYNGSTVNIYAGEIGEGYFIMVVDGGTVTVYGTDFAVDGVPLDPSATEFTPAAAGSILTGTYGGAAGDINLLFYSDIPIFLAAPGGEPMQAQLWVFPSVINRYSRLPTRIFALLRLPEGVTKDDISDNPLVLYADEYDVEIEASCQRIIQWCGQGALRVSILASFDKAELMAAVPDDGEVELQVEGQLNTGQHFYGTDTIRIISRRWRPWWERR